MTRPIFSIVACLLFVQSECNAQAYAPAGPNTSSAEDVDILVKDLDPALQAQIFNALTKDTHGDFPAMSVEEQRFAILEMEAEEITLRPHGAKYWLITGTPENGFCGVTGNCSFWVLMRDRSHLRVLLSGFGALGIEDTVTRGMYDLTVSSHMSCCTSSSDTYKWTGSGYEWFDCKETKEDGSIAICKD